MRAAPRVKGGTFPASRQRDAQGLSEGLRDGLPDGLPDGNWERDGFMLVERFAEPATCRAMLERADALARDAKGAGLSGRAMVLPEARPSPGARSPEERVSKIFRLHRDEQPFADFARNEALLDWVARVLGEGLDCFLSQFIYKQPGVMGQPWHQDAWYFPFDRGPQVGVWLAVTEARLDNGPLYVLPGSHREPIHATVPDPRPLSNYGYVEIVDHDMTGAVPVLIQPGDLLVFHSHLMHMSTDNGSGDLRAAMVYHYAAEGTRDLSRERSGAESPVNDWLPVRRRRRS